VAIFSLKHRPYYLRPYPQKLGDPDKIFVSGVGNWIWEEKSEGKKRILIPAIGTCSQPDFSKQAIDAGSAFVKLGKVLLFR